MLTAVLLPATLLVYVFLIFGIQNGSALHQGGLGISESITYKPSSSSERHGFTDQSQDVSVLMSRTSNGEANRELLCHTMRNSCTQQRISAHVSVGMDGTRWEKRR